MSRKPHPYLLRGLSLLCTMGMLAAFLFTASADFPLIVAASDTYTSGESPIHILLIGQDRRETEDLSRADSILLCTFQPDTSQVIVTSFLRDLYVPIPGYPSNRLNAAYAHGGMALLRQTLEENFEIPIDGCIEADFNQFAQVLDILGGVTVDLRQDEADTINKAIPGNLSSGTQTLNGSQALAYTRIRNLDDDGDFSRTCRQRKVIAALLSSYQDAGLFTVLSVIPKILPMLSTDMENKQMISTVLKLLPMMGSCTITNQQVPSKDQYSYETIRGMAVLTADLAVIRKNLEETIQ